MVLFNIKVPEGKNSKHYLTVPGTLLLCPLRTPNICGCVNHPVSNHQGGRRCPINSFSAVNGSILLEHRLHLHDDDVMQEAVTSDVYDACPPSPCQGGRRSSAACDGSSLPPRLRGGRRTASRVSIFPPSGTFTVSVLMDGIGNWMQNDQVGSPGAACELRRASKARPMACSFLCVSLVADGSCPFSSARSDQQVEFTRLPETLQALGSPVRLFLGLISEKIKGDFCLPPPPRQHLAVSKDVFGCPIGRRPGMLLTTLQCSGRLQHRE